jgi:hypothetical protein
MKKSKNKIKRNRDRNDNRLNGVREEKWRKSCEIYFYMRHLEVFYVLIVHSLFLVLAAPLVDG